MPVSLSGLDLSWLKDPTKRLPPAPKKKRANYSKRSKKLALPSFVGDIKPFVANATQKPVEITSRSQLRAYERGNDIRQCGDFKPGEIISSQNKRMEAFKVSEADAKASDFKWVD
jgi:hypothetical protein